MLSYSKQEILDFMRAESVMSAAVNGFDYPVSTVLLFAIDDDFTVYFATHSDSNKAKAISADNRMSLSVWAHHKMLVQGCGNVSKLENPDDISIALDKLSASVVGIADFWPPVLRIEGLGYSVYKLKLKSVRALDLTSEKIKEKDLPFTTYEL